jgi:cation:H+ antiporter
MSLAIAIVFFVCGLFVITKGGSVLVGSALRLSKVSGINQVIIGATFVSIATTLPEVFVSIFAVAAGNHGIAVGNAMGSMICNIALVLALYIIFMPNRVSRRTIASRATILFFVIAILFLFASNLRITGFEGVVLLFAFVLFLALNIWEAKRDSEKTVKPANQLQLNPAQKKKETIKIILGFLIGQGMLIFGAFVLVRYGEQIAILLGASETVVGLTAIAIGTSAPELITCIESIRKKSGGLALGNVLGSNIISCTLLLGVCSVVGSFSGGNLPISADTVYISLPFLFVISLVAVVPMMFKGRNYRWQGVCLLTLYTLYISYLLVVQPV